MIYVPSKIDVERLTGRQVIHKAAQKVFGAARP